MAIVRASRPTAAAPAISLGKLQGLDPTISPHSQVKRTQQFSWPCRSISSPPHLYRARCTDEKKPLSAYRITVFLGGATRSRTGLDGFAILSQNYLLLLIEVGKIYINQQLIEHLPGVQAVQVLIKVRENMTLSPTDPLQVQEQQRWHDHARLKHPTWQSLAT